MNSIRREISDILDSIVMRAEPVTHPIEIIALLNETGPTLDHRHIPFIEAILEGMYADGLIGRMASPHPNIMVGYCSTLGAAKAHKSGIPITLLPRNGAYPSSRLEEALSHFAGEYVSEFDP